MDRDAGPAGRTHRGEGPRRQLDAGCRDLLHGYSTNVHPGEDLAQVLDSLERFAIPVRRAVFGDRAEAGLELRLGIGAARDLLRPAAREKLAAFLGESRLRLFSINAYPLRDFHAPRVKEEAYRPAWTDPARPLWTRRIAGILAALLPPGLAGTISTLGGTYRRWGDGPRARAAIARGYLEVIEELEEIEERSGRRIALAVEPEPDTTFETAGDLIRFFEGVLLPAARRRWKGRLRTARIEEVLRGRFTVNLDTCHLSVVFRRPAGEMEVLRRAGIAIGKVHVTSAVALERPAVSPRAYAQLRGMDEPRYLHQVRGADGRGRPVLALADLGDLPGDPGALGRAVRLRSHFHLPVSSARWGRLETTREETREAVLLALRKDLCRQLVIETYTWPVIAGRGRGRLDLVREIAREFRWLLGVILEEKRRSGPSLARSRIPLSRE